MGAMSSTLGALFLSFSFFFALTRKLREENPKKASGEKQMAPTFASLSLSLLQKWCGGEEMKK